MEWNEADFNNPANWEPFGPLDSFDIFAEGVVSRHAYPDDLGLMTDLVIQELKKDGVFRVAVQILVQDRIRPICERERDAMKQT
jgi:hypothetical protein